MPNPCRICKDPDHTHNTHHLICVDCGGQFHKNKVSSKCPKSDRAQLSEMYPVDPNHWMILHREDKWSQVKAHMAGFFDAEGCVRRRSDSNSLWVDMSQNEDNNGEPCNGLRIARHLWNIGGLQKSSTDNTWRWMLSSTRDCVTFLNDIIPFMLEPHKKAMLIDAFSHVLPPRNVTQEFTDLSIYDPICLKAYMTGFWEGDGSIYVNTSKNLPYATISQKDPFVLDIAKQLWCGNVYKSSTEGKHFWTTVSMDQTEKFIEEIKPWLTNQYRRDQINKVMGTWKSSRDIVHQCTSEFCMKTFTSEKRRVQHVQSCKYVNDLESIPGKECQKCSKWKPLPKFGGSRNPTGKDIVCRDCRSQS